MTSAIRAARRSGRRDVHDQPRRYGLGVWLHESSDIVLEGYDADVSFRTAHDPESRTTSTVISNTTQAAWPIAKMLTDTCGAASGRRAAGSLAR